MPPKKPEPSAVNRLKKEKQALEKPGALPQYIVATNHLPTNILEWYFVMAGPADTPYEAGRYVGVVLFPSDYPFSPPGFKVLTPSGRFVPNQKLCLSMSDFHRDTWNPAWNIGTMLVGLVSFFASEEIATGAVHPAPSADERLRLAAESHSYNQSHFAHLKAALPCVMEGNKKERDNCDIDVEKDDEERKKTKHEN